MSDLKKPYLLQRCKTKAPFDPTMRSSDYLSFDYMGASEFEFGALFRFQQEIHPKLDNLEIFTCTWMTTTLYFMVEPGQEKEYAQFVRDLIDDKLRMKERSGLQDREDYRDPKSPFRYDVWWDLDNAVVITRHPEVLRNLKVTVRNSIRLSLQKK